MIWLLTAILSIAHGKGLMVRVGTCKNVPKDAASVMLVKQWHLSPRTITKGFRERYPQEKNQTAIYISLADRIKHKKMDLLVAEGCEGEINEQFTTTFNGWDLATLKKQSQTRGFDKLVTHVPLKLEARYGDKVLTMCGDNDKLIQEGLVRLSNLRGWAGYWGKLSETSTNIDAQKQFAESAAALLKVDKETPMTEMLPKIQGKIGEELSAFKKTLSDRNDSFIKALQAAQPFKNAAIVIGGLHVEDLKAKLEAAGFACDVMEPTGYAREDENVIREFERALTK